LILPLHTGLRGAHEGNGRWESERTANLWPKAHSNVVGIHYAFAGPTRPAWESASGSRVVAARTVAPVTVDTNAIPWLVLNAVPENTIGPGIFERTTYIQRVNTTGGLAPSSPPTALGQEARVPYTAEYYFYRAVK